jgi:alpha-D-xyloside xylohydrolase
MYLGVHPSPSEARDIEIDDHSLTVYAPTKRIQHRGDTLNLATLTVRFSSPLENVIRVQLTHHKGGKPRKPKFTIFENPPRVPLKRRPNMPASPAGAQRGSAEGSM